MAKRGEVEGGPAAAARLQRGEPGGPERWGRESTKPEKADTKVAYFTSRGNNVSLAPVERGVKGDGKARGRRGA